MIWFLVGCAVVVLVGVARARARRRPGRRIVLPVLRTTDLDSGVRKARAPFPDRLDGRP